MKKKISFLLACVMVLSVVSHVENRGEAKQKKNPLKSYRLKQDSFDVKQGQTKKISLALLKGKKKVKFKKKAKTEKLSATFKVTFQDAANGSVSVSKNGVIRVYVKPGILVDEKIGEVTTTLKLKKKSKKKWKSYKKKLVTDIYVCQGDAQPTVVVTPKPKQTVENPETPAPSLLPTATPQWQETPSPTPEELPKETMDPDYYDALYGTPEPLCECEKITEEWFDRVPGLYDNGHCMMYTWDELVAMGKVEVEGSTLKKIDVDDIEKKYQCDICGAKYHTDSHSIVFPNTITTIGERACEGDALIKNEDNDAMFFDDKDAEWFTKRRGKEVSFEDFKFHDSIVLPESLTTIEDYAFYSSNIAVIEIPENVTSIGNHAFQNCSSLEYVKLSDNVTTIGDYAFEGNRSMSTLNIPKKLKKIGKNAFSQGLSIGDTYRNHGYGKEQMESTRIDLSNVEEIGEGAFASCYFIKSIRWSNTIKQIPSYCFTGCGNGGNGLLESVEIPEGVTSIAIGAFDWCNLKELNLPSTVTKVGAQSWETFPDVKYEGQGKWESKQWEEYADYWIGDFLTGRE